MSDARNSNLQSYDLDVVAGTNRRKKSWKPVALRYLIVLAVVLGLCLIGLSIYTGVMLSHTEGNADTAPYACMSEDCIKTAAQILNAMNQTVDPCDDFYEFACGGWPDHNMIRSDQMEEWNQFAKLDEYRKKYIIELLEDDTPAAEGSPTIVNKVKSLYKSCKGTYPVKQEELTKSLMSSALSLVGLPAGVSQNWTGKPWYEQDARSTRLLDISTLINVQFSLDPTNHSRFVITVNRPQEPDSYTEVKKTTQEENVGDASNVLDSEVETKQIYDTIKSFESLLQKLLLDDAEYENVTIYDCNIPKSMQTYLESYLDILFENTSRKLNLHEDKLLINVQYLIELSKLLNDTSDLDVENYMVSNVFTKMAGKTATPETCVEYIYYNLGFALDYLYVQRHFRNFSIQKATEMVDDIRDAFGAVVESLDWLDEATRLKAQKKLGAMRKFIGFSKWQLTPESSRLHLDQYYNAVEVVEGDFFESYVKIQQRKFNKSLNKELDLNDWSKFPATKETNAFYEQISNSIYISIIVLQRPFYDNGLEAINYGSIGSIMGHEITHGFDNEGRKYDENGYLENWWTDAARKHYENKTQCIVDQYNVYGIDGKTSPSENIADNGGLRAAFNAFTLYTQRNPDGNNARLPGILQYDPQQLFFLGFGQNWCVDGKEKITNNSHAPNKIRVIGTLSNSQEFADAWKCPAGSPMNPKHKCVLW